MLKQLITKLPEVLQPVLIQNWDKVEARVTVLENLPDRFADDLAKVLTGSDYVTEQFGRSSGLLEGLLSSHDL